MKLFVDFLLENGKIFEDFSFGGKEYKSAFGRYYCNGEEISDREYHNARERFDDQNDRNSLSRNRSINARRIIRPAGKKHRANISVNKDNADVSLQKKEEPKQDTSSKKAPLEDRQKARRSMISLSGINPDAFKGFSENEHEEVRKVLNKMRDAATRAEDLGDKIEFIEKNIDKLSKDEKEYFNRSKKNVEEWNKKVPGLIEIKNSKTPDELRDSIKSFKSSYNNDNEYFRDVDDNYKNMIRNIQNK